MKPVVIVCLLGGALAACSFRSTTVERPAPAPTTATVVTTEPPPKGAVNPFTGKPL